MSHALAAVLRRARRARAISSRSRNLRFAAVSRGLVLSWIARGLRGGFAAPAVAAAGLYCGPRYAAIWHANAHQLTTSRGPRDEALHTSGAPTEGSERKVEAEGVRNSKLKTKNSKLKTGWGERVEKSEIRNPNSEIDPGYLPWAGGFARISSMTVSSGPTSIPPMSTECSTRAPLRTAAPSARIDASTFAPLSMVTSRPTKLATSDAEESTDDVGWTMVFPASRRLMTAM